jgi:hypothetical protein
MIANGDEMGIGNHDSEIADDRAAQMKYMQTLPYSLAEPGPQGVDGVGNCKSRFGRQSAGHQLIFSVLGL